MEDKQLSYDESMKLINSMIGKAKKSYVTKGIAAIVWGVLIVLCSLVTWAEIRYDFDPGFDVWMLLLIALVPQIYFAIKERKQKKFTSYEEETAAYVWTAFAISIFITSYYNSKYGNDTNSYTSLIMILYGIPTFITGGMVKFRPMITGGIICWVLAIVSISTGNDIDMLLMAACGLFAWVIPGIILWNRNKKRQAENGI